MNSYQEENDQLLQNLLERTFYRAWREGPKSELTNYRALEIDPVPVCNLSCKYCYYSRFGNELYPPHLYKDEKKILNNLSSYCDFLIENEFNPEIEYFSGEALVQKVGLDGLDILLDKMLGNGWDGPLVIPTNYTFLLNDKLTERVEGYIERCKQYDVRLSLSASDDGKFCNANRPFKASVENMIHKHGITHWTYNDFEDPRGDGFYKKLFKFNKKHGYGFHPMIYSDNIELWMDNFLWFQDMMKEYDIPWWNIYLLEVRNPEWSIEQCREYEKFIHDLIVWLFEKKSGKNPDVLVDHLFNHRGFNTLSSTLSSGGRGLGCSYQSNIYLRLGDLAIMPCHRTSYDPMIIGHYNTDENNKITGITSKNIEMMVAGQSLVSKNFPYCEQCLLKELCTQGCLGAQLETTGDPFTPIPTVCRLEHAKVRSMIRTYKEIGAFEEILSRVNENKKFALKQYESMLGGENTE